jgi:hypothetical protein
VLGPRAGGRGSSGFEKARGAGEKMRETMMEGPEVTSAWGGSRERATRGLDFATTRVETYEQIF